MRLKTKRRSRAKPAAVAYPGKPVYTESEVRFLLGERGRPLSRTTMYKLRVRNLINYTRLYPGGPVRYLPEHIRQYQQYLAGQSHQPTTIESLELVLECERTAA